MPPTDPDSRGRTPTMMVYSVNRLVRSFRASEAPHRPVPAFKFVIPPASNFGIQAEHSSHSEF